MLLEKDHVGVLLGANGGGMQLQIIIVMNDLSIHFAETLSSTS